MLKRFYFSGLIISIFSFLVFIGCEKKGTESKPDFTIKVTPTSRTVAQGDSTNFTVKILPLEGFNSEVTLSLGGLLAADGSAIFEDSILSPSDSTTLWIKTTPSIALGTKNLTLTASGGGKAHISNLSLNVEPDFTLKVTPTSRTVAQGDSTSFSVKILPTEGFNSDVNLSLSGLPSGGSAIFEDTILSPSDSTTLWIKTIPSIALGTKNLTLTAGGGGKTHTTNLTLNVVAKLSELKLYFQKIGENRILSDVAGTFVSQERILNDTLVWKGFFMNQNLSFDSAYFYLYFYLYRDTPTPLATIHMQIQSGGQTHYDADVDTLPEGITGGTDTFDTLRVVFPSGKTFYSGEEIKITLRAQGYSSCIFKYGGTPYDSYVRFY